MSAPIRSAYRLSFGEVAGPVVALALLAAAAVASAAWHGPWLDVGAAASTWATVTMAIIVQAVPFLVLGVVISGLISAFVPASLLARFSPRSEILAVPSASLAGMALPGCECASVPVTHSLMRRGLSKPAALVFMLAAPAVNPVVLVATAVAFNALPQMVWARLGASLLAVMIVGWLWVAFGRDEWVNVDDSADDGHPKAAVFRDTVSHDFLHAGGFLVLGAMVAALIKVLVPGGFYEALATQPVLAVLLFAFLAVLMSLCSEADAFVAASFVGVSPMAQLAFLVVGPMVDIKLIAMQAGIFGRGFALRFVPVTFVVAVASALAVGRLVFGG